MENQSTSIAPNKKLNAFSQHIFFKNELKNCDSTELANLKDKLEILCLQYDPYIPQSISEECSALIHEFGLEEVRGNPFEFTNKLLVLMEVIDTEISKLENVTQ